MTAMGCADINFNIPVVNVVYNAVVRFLVFVSDMNIFSLLLLDLLFF